MIASIEAAIIERLRQGMGQLVTGVHSYGGELDDEGLYQVAQQTPAVWVTFGGIPKTEPAHTSHGKYKAGGRFVVMCAARSYRSEAASRTGGPSRWEIGSYDLIYAIRRLLTRQDLGLPCDYLQPGAVRTLFNGRLEHNEAMSVFACEFDTHWYEEPLPNGAWPQTPDSPQHPDQLFVDYSGALSPPDPDLTGVRLKVHSPPEQPDPAVEAEVPLK